MQTRFFDSEWPGPPNGWLDRDQGLTAQERAVWNHVVAAIRAATRDLAKSVSGNASIQFWGGLHLSGLSWVYRSIPTEVGRPGRTVAVFFSASEKSGFDWASIEANGSELETLANDPSHVTSLASRINKHTSSVSLTDDLLRQSPTLLIETLKSEMNRMLSGLSEGWHEYFTIFDDGTISNRGQENISTKPTPTHNSTLEPGTPSAPGKKPPPSKSPVMKILISHALFMVIGLLLGFGLHGDSSQKKPIQKPAKNQPDIRSVEEAFYHLRRATDYLEDKWNRPSGSPSPGELQTQPVRNTPAQQREGLFR